MDLGLWRGTRDTLSCFSPICGFLSRRLFPLTDPSMPPPPLPPERSQSFLSLSLPFHHLSSVRQDRCHNMRDYAGLQSSVKTFLPGFGNGCLKYCAIPCAGGTGSTSHTVFLFIRVVHFWGEQRNILRVILGTYQKCFYTALYTVFRLHAMQWPKPPQPPPPPIGRPARDAVMLGRCVCFYRALFPSTSV